MSKHLAQLLDMPEVLVEGAIKQLEHFSSFKGTDIKLLSKANNRIRAKIADLGLDPDDTTGPELYHGLRVRFVEDEKEFSKNIGFDHAAYFTQKLLMNQDVSALKKSVAKGILRKKPPRKLMKQLGYRSIDSMLKRENVSKIYALLSAVESERWLNAWWRDMANLHAADFESRQIEIVTLNAVNPQNEHISMQPFMGSIAVWTGTQPPMSDLGLSLQILEHANIMKVDSALIKLKQPESNFGKSLVDFLKNGTKEPLEIHHLPVSWKTFFHHFGKNLEDYSELFGPHIISEDLKLHNPIKMLAKTSPSLRWWSDLSHAGKLYEQKALSLNIMDVLHNHHHDLPYESRTAMHMESSLWHELVDKYLEHSPVKSFAISKLDAITVPQESTNSMPTANEFLEEPANLVEAA
jgi:hypothetical protein